MSISKEQLLHRYTETMHNADAALFVGAGLSRSAGFVDWKGLLRDCAKELGLDVDREHDLVAVAQYHLNRRSRDRSCLNQILKNEFDKPGKITKNHDIISRLPIATVWTTNFDALIEGAYRKQGRIVDVKHRDRDLGTTKKNREVVIYKMHGDIASPDEVIICKDDYERYARKHEVFQNALEGDLVQKTFLFLGFSFTDPNLEYMLGHLRSLLEDSKREHYAIMRHVSRADFPKGRAGQRDYEYEKNKQDLQIEDLQRYSIQTLLVDKYEEITTILEELENRYYYKNIFVSGSASDYGKFGERRMQDFCQKLGNYLIENGYNLVSGFGVNIGSSVIMGALAKLYESSQPIIEKRLLLRPFPQKQLHGIKKAQFNKKYREDMIKLCGFVIFVAGNKPGYQVATGVLEEYAISKTLSRIPIPIGATGFAAKKIWKMIEPKIRSVYSGKVAKSQYDKLNDFTLSNDDLVTAIFKIIEQIEKT